MGITLNFFPEFTRRIVRFSLSVLVLASVLALSAGRADAQPLCLVEVSKEAVPDEEIEFGFRATEGGEVLEFSLLPGIIEVFDFSPPGVLQLVEVFPDGWVIGDVDCDIDGDIFVSVVGPRTVNFTCREGGEAFCTIINVQVAKNIPTLSEWGMIAAAAGLVLVGSLFAVRRRKATV